MNIYLLNLSLVQITKQIGCIFNKNELFHIGLGDIWYNQNYINDSGLCDIYFATIKQRLQDNLKSPFPMYLSIANHLGLHISEPIYKTLVGPSTCNPRSASVNGCFVLFLGEPKQSGLILI